MIGQQMSSMINKDAALYHETSISKAEIVLLPAKTGDADKFYHEFSF